MPLDVGHNGPVNRVKCAKGRVEAEFGALSSPHTSSRQNSAFPRLSHFGRSERSVDRVISDPKTTEYTQRI